MNNKFRSIHNRYIYVYIIGLAILYIVFLFNLYKVLDLAIDSDMSSEMVYGKLLHDGNVFFNANWYSSTGISIFGCSNIFAIIFSFTNNWHYVRIIAILILTIFIYVCFYYICKQLKIQNIRLYSCLLIFPLSYSYYEFVIKGLFYAPLVIFSLLMVGLFISIVDNSNNKNIKKILLFLVSLITSLSGIRNIVTMFCPLLCASTLLFTFDSIFNKKRDIKKTESKESLILSCEVFAISILGYIGSKLLGEYVFNYSSGQYGLTSKNLLNFGETFIKVLKDGWLELSGITGSNIKSIIPVAFIIITVAGSIIILFKKEYSYIEKYIVTYFVVSACAISSTFFISDLGFESRYLIQSFVFLPVIFAIYNNHINSNYKYLFIVLLTIHVIVNSYDVLNVDRNDKTNSELIKIKDILIENNVYNGYSTFWNANVLTEMSDGQIEVWSLEEQHSVVEFNKIYEWLQKKDHTTTYPSGKVFLVLNTKEINRTDLNLEINKYNVFKGDDKSLFIFNNIDIYNEIVKD